MRFSGYRGLSETHFGPRPFGARILLAELNNGKVQNESGHLMQHGPNAPIDDLVHQELRFLAVLGVLKVPYDGLCRRRAEQHLAFARLDTGNLPQQGFRV